MVFILKTVTTWLLIELTAWVVVKVGGKTYKFEIIYYDDESNPKRAAQLAERLISQDGVEYMLGPYSSGLTKAIAL